MHLKMQINANIAPGEIRILDAFTISGLHPRMSHHYRAHKMSVWLNLIPQLQKTGLSSTAAMMSHNSLAMEDGPTWGVIRNESNVQATIDKHAEVRQPCREFYYA